MSGDIYSFPESDPRMGAAMEEARRSLRMFFDAYLAPEPNQHSFLLKVLFESDGAREHIWVAEINALVSLYGEPLRMSRGSKAFR
jgi:hypothetical protein